MFTNIKESIREALGNDYIEAAAVMTVNAIAFCGGLLCTVGNYYKNRPMTVIGAGLVVTMPIVSQKIMETNIKVTIERLNEREAN